MNTKLIMSIVPHDEGENITKILKNAGSSGGTILMGRGTAENAFLRILGIGDTSKDIVLTIVNESLKNQLMNALIQETSNFKPHYGIAFSIDISMMFRSGSMGKNEKTMEENNMTEKTHKLINVILNKGFADDAMEAARKAGAGGGTIMHARGTAKKEDVSFLGINIVPEKEILMILVEKEKAESVLQAICNLPCLQEPGSGIAYCMDVDSFTGLGKKQENPDA